MEREDLVLEESSRVALITLAAGEESPWHHHSAVTEQVVCVSGKITLKLAEASMPVILSSGQRHQILPGVKHSLSNSEGVASTYLLVQRKRSIKHPLYTAVRIFKDTPRFNEGMINEDDKQTTILARPCFGRKT